MAAVRRWLAFTPALVPTLGLAAGLALSLAAACVHDRGEIELNWTIVDLAGDQVFPFGFLGDTCGFSGKLAEADAAARDYALQVRLRLCDPACAAGCDDPTCQVDVLRFDCSAARGFATVPSSEEPYDIRVDLVASPDDGACGCSLTPPCALVPGPRRRAVEPGLVTDLQVYLLVLGLEAIADSYKDGRAQLDLSTCCTPDPTCAAP